MSADQFGNVPPAAPPTEAGPTSIPSAPSSWPTVLGVIALVFGAGGALSGGLGTFSSNLMKAMSLSTMNRGQAINMEMVAEATKWSIPFSLLSMAVAIILLAAGIQLLRRRAAAVNLCRIWAVIKMLLVLLSVVVASSSQNAMWSNMSRQGPMPLGRGAMMASTAIGACFGILFGFALPVFMLIWFARRKIKDEAAGWP